MELIFCTLAAEDLIYADNYCSVRTVLVLVSFISRPSAAEMAARVDSKKTTAFVILWQKTPPLKGT